MASEYVRTFTGKRGHAMKVSFLAVIAAALTLTGCTTLPKSAASDYPITAAEIFRAVACEFALALTRYPDLENWGATVDLTISNSADVTVVPGLEWSATINGAKLSATPSGDVTTKVSGSVKISHPLPEVGRDAPAECPDTSAAGKGLGLAAELGRQMSIIEGSDPFAITEMLIDRSFSVSRSVGGNLTFTVGSVSVGFDGSKASSSNSHAIAIGLKPLAGQSPDLVQKQIRDELNRRNEDQRITDILRDLTEAT